jgi:hypothetical protein
MGDYAEEKPQFVIVDEEGLAWYARKMAAIDGEISRVQTQAKAIVAELERDREGLEFQYGQQAENVTRRLLEERGKRTKHIKTLYGNLGYRGKPARLEITNHSALLAWTQEHAPCLVETRVTSSRLLERFKVSSVGDVVFDLEDNSNPLVLPGVVLQGAQEQFYVRAASPQSLED